MIKSVHLKNTVTKRIRISSLHSYAILISPKTMTIFHNTSADIKTKSADVILKMVIVLSEMRIA